MPAITPVAKSLTFCDYHFGVDHGKIDLYGVFNSINPAEAYPLRNRRFCIFAQLVNGLGKVPFSIDILHAQSGEIAWSSGIKYVSFRDRVTTVQLAYQVENCLFNRPGLYLVELFCNNAFVSDAALLLQPFHGDSNGKHHSSE